MSGRLVLKGRAGLTQQVDATSTVTTLIDADDGSFNLLKSTLTGEVVTINSQSIRVLAYDNAGKILWATGTAAYTTQDSQDDYAKGAFYIDTDVTTGTSGLYHNIGTSSSSSFQLVDTTSATTFTGLTDTPANYTSAGDKMVKVNTGATALEFVDVSGDVDMSASGVFSISSGVIVNDDVNAAAAIAWSKFATSTDISNTGTVTDFTIASEARGDVLYRGASAWLRLGAGTAGQALVTAGAGADPYWGTPNVANASSLANSVTCEAGASDYTLAFGTAGGAYTLTVPAVGGSRTFSFIDEDETITGIKTFANEGVHVLDTNASHDLIIKAGSDLTADRIFTITTGDAARTLNLGGDFTTGGTWTHTGAHTVGITTQNNGTFAFADGSAYALTFPTGTLTLASLTGTETLSDKTLTTPKIVTTGAICDAGGDEYVVFIEDSAPVNQIEIGNANTGFSPVLSVSGGDANIGLKIRGKGTGKVTIADGATPTKLMDFDLSGATGTKTMTIVSSHSDDRSVTLPNATDTLVGKATTDTLTNKSFDCDGTGNVLTNVNANELDPITMGASTFGVPFIITYNLTNQASAVNIFNANAPFKFRVIDAYSVSTSADGGTWKLNNGALGAGTDLTDVVTVAASDNDIDRVAEIVDAAWEIAQNGSLSVVPDGGGALDCMIFVTCMRVD